MANWKNKVVVVTGGSSGLGAAIALEFAEQNANVVVLARNLDRNFAMVSNAAEKGWNVSSCQCDVTDNAQVTAAVKQIIDNHKQIDVWVNCVGASIRADIRQTGVDVYQQQMEINLYPAIRCSNAVLDHLEKSSGSLVNIGSLASKTAWQFMAPYSASKHALAAYSHQLRIEGPQNIHYLLVCPGPIIRADSGQRYSDSAADLPESAKQPGGGARVKGLKPDWLAKKIVAACERRKPELVLPWKSRLLFSITQLSPRLGDWLLKKFG